MAKKKKGPTPDKAEAELRYIAAIRAPLRHELADANAHRARAEDLLKSGEATMYENVKVVGELNQELFSLRKEIAAEKTSVEFWIYEASRWRKEAEDLRREEAMARVARGER